MCVLLRRASQQSVDPGRSWIVGASAPPRAAHLSNIYLDEADHDHAANQSGMELVQKLTAQSTMRVAACTWLPNLDCRDLDSDRKAHAGIALHAFESADIITRRGRLDLGQPHGIAALGAGENSDFSTAVEWIRMGGWHDARLRSGGSAILSVTGDCR